MPKMIEPAKKVFAWVEYQRWRPVVMQLLKDIFDRTVLDYLKDNPPRYFVADDLSWLDDAIAAAKNIPEANAHQILTHRLPTAFSYVRAFHGCRPESLESYRSHGVRPCDPSQLNEEAFRIFSDRLRIEKAINAWATEGLMSYPEHNRGKVFFCLNKEELVERCGHYLLYGSEYLLSLAGAVGGHQCLRNRGRATIIECNVPTTWLDEDYLQCLTGEMLREVCERFCLSKRSKGIGSFGFPIKRALPPELIVGFSHPTGIPNPRNRGIRED